MANRYWVGGAGNWSSATKWSTTSGGASGASVPTSADNAIFDANSGGKFTATVDTAQQVNSLLITPSSGTGLLTISLTASLTTGALSIVGTAGNNRVFFTSTTYGIAINFVVNGAVNISDCDFRGIYVTGTAAPISGTRIGNRGECRGITFSTPKTVYWSSGSGNWSDNVWATSAGGAVSTDNFPLPQDTATFVNTGFISSGIVTLNSLIAYVPTVDMSGRTNAMTVNAITATAVYGSWANGSGTTINGASTLTFSGGTTQTITSAGKAFSCPITVDNYGGTVQLADALDIGSNTLTVTNGTFDTAGYAVTAGVLSSTNSNVRTITLGSSTVSLLGTNPITFTTATNLVFNAGTSQINISATSAVTFAGNGLSFYNVSFTGDTAASHSITGANTFNNLTFTAPSTNDLMQCGFAANQTITGTLTCAGASAVRRIFLRSSTIGTQRDLTVGTLSANDCDFRDIEILGTASGTAPTRAGDCGNNAGITFPSPKTVYWNLAGTQNWSATGWASSSGGAPDINQFPLAQDTAVFDNTGSVGTVSMDGTWNIGTFDASGRTSAMTLTAANFPVIYGDWKFGTGVTSPVDSGYYTFAKNGTQTITSNGVQFGSQITINRSSCTVQLADALSLGSTKQLLITSGTFDAVIYNVTTGTFNAGSSSTVRMGSGTWTLSGTGTVWSVGSTTTPIYVGTSTIVLSDNSTAARTFAGNYLYYNKLTIGGTTGTSTLTITGGNTFVELASTKTVAHTIVFSSSTTTTIGKWSVTGTVGNVVKLAPSTAATTYTLFISGPANTGIDYLSVSYCAVSTTSPGEFYVGANSTNTAGNTGPIFFTATPAPRTLYWVGGTGNWSSTTKWSTSSGGASGAAIPTSLDAVVFNSASSATAYTATIDAGVTIARCASFTMAGPASGNVTFAGTIAIAFHGNVSFAATGITRTYSGAMYCVGNSSYTFTTNGLSLASGLYIFGIGSTWSLGSSLTTSTFISVNYGTFATNNFALSCTQLSSSASPYGVRAISLGASTVTLSQPATNAFSASPLTNLTFSSGTSQINFSGTTSGISVVSSGFTFYNVSFTSASATSIAIIGANTFNTLSFAGRTSFVGVNAVEFSANQTITTLTLNAGTDAAYRTLLSSNALGTQRTLSVGTLTAGAADYDFRDIAITGAAAPLTGTRFGDAKGNSGITFPAAKTVYTSGGGALASWNSTIWATTAGGAVAAVNFPLAQDTAVITSGTPTSAGTINITDNYNIGTIDMSARTANTMTLATGSTAPVICGNWINGTGITLTGTGTLIFAGRGSQSITSAGRTFTQPIFVNSPSGSVTLQDAFSSSVVSAALTLNWGTFDASTYNVTLSAGFVSISNNNVKTFAFGSGTWTFAGASSLSVSGTNTTITGTGTFTLTRPSAKSFSGGGASYSGMTLNQGGAGTLTISGNNTFKDITNTYSATGAAIISLGSTTTTLTQFTGTGQASRLLSLTGTALSPANLILTSGAVTTPNYLIISNVRAYSLSNTWYAGANSTNGGSLGWIFAAYVPPVTANYGGFFPFFS